MAKEPSKTQQMAAPRGGYDGPPWRQQEEIAPPALMPAGAVAQTGATEFITAQQVAMARQKRMNEIQLAAKREAHANGESFYYRIPYRENKGKPNERTVYVEGPSIKLANTAARIWGNCLLRSRVEDMGDAFVFYGQFVDLETGFTLERPFRQRKKQNTGMGHDSERQMDQVFQIGVSKAQRNAVVNALPELVNEMMRIAKQALVKKIGDNFEAAWNYYGGKIEALGIDITRVERIYGKPYNKFLVPDLAKLHTEINAIEDSVADPDEVWPVDEGEGEAHARANQREAAEAVDQKSAKAQPAEKKQEKAGGSQKAGGARRTKDQQADKPARESKPADVDPGDDAVGGGEDGASESAPDQGEAPEADEAAAADEADVPADDGGDDAPPADAPAEPDPGEPDDGDAGDDATEFGFDFKE